MHKSKHGLVVGRPVSACETNAYQSQPNRSVTQRNARMSPQTVLNSNKTHRQNLFPAQNKRVPCRPPLFPIVLMS